jgi:hypothetical protein
VIDLTRRTALAIPLAGLAVAAVPHSARAELYNDQQFPDITPHPAFAQTYREARGKFLAAARHAGAAISSQRLPALLGLDGQPLYMDFAWIGPADADVVIVSMSGTHGSEGFTGSAVQNDWLTSGNAAKLPPRVASLMVHAVNPFGFDRNLRVNENGVDLNRNFIDFSKPNLPDNPIYDAIHAQLPDIGAGHEDVIAQYNAVIAAAVVKYGEWAVFDACGRGQYRHPTGYGFGGTEAQWSSKTLVQELRRLCARARHVVYIDWHTIYPNGDGRQVFLCFNQTNDPLYRRVASWWTAQAIDRDIVNAQEGIRRPTRNGLAMWGVQRALAPRIDVAGAVVEFSCDPDGLVSSPDADERGEVWAQWLLANKDDQSLRSEFVRTFFRESAGPWRRGYQNGALAAARSTYARATVGAAVWARDNIAATPGKLLYFSAFT